MKYFVLATPKAAFPQPVDPVAEAIAARDYVNTNLAEGTLDCIYNLADGRGIAILNVEDNEMLWERLMSYPLTPRFNYEVFPLVDVNFVFDQLMSELKDKAPAF